MLALEERLKQAEADAATYNRREALLGLPITDYSGVKKLGEQCEPFIQFWTTASAFKVGVQM